MPPFQNARPDYKRRTLRIWNNQVGPDLRDPELLWGMTWERFNTVRVPVLDEDEYFERALEIAKSAKDKEDFERSFKERNAKDWAKLLGLMSEISLYTLYHDEEDVFPCRDAWRKTRKVSRTGSLMDFVRLLKGVALGWEADEVRETQVDNPPSGEEAPAGAEYTGQEEVFVEMEDLDWEEELALQGDCSDSVIFHGTYTYFPASEPASKAPDAALCADGDVLSMQQDAAPSGMASSSEADGSKETQRLQRKRKRLRFSDDIVQVPEPNQASSPHSADDGSVTGERQLPSDGNDRASKRRKLDDSPTRSHTNPSCQHDQSIPKKRPIRDDDDDGDGEQRHKRHKANSFLRNHAEAETDTSRINKRPICDDDNETHDHDDNDNDEHRHKRQRRDASSSSRQQAEADVNESRVSSKQRSGRSRRKRSNANRAPENIKTRSLNRVRPSTFWELDHTGKASIRI